jgi:ABC-type uncharacterized transport system permease subunit
MEQLQKERKVGESRSPFFYLKAIAALLFFLSLAAMVCAGLLFNDIRAAEARFLPETWQAVLLDRGVPQSLHFSLSVAFSLGVGAFAGMVYAFAAVSERMLRSP